MSQPIEEPHSLSYVWNETWARVVKEHSGSALWDVEHRLSVALDWSVFKDTFPTSLPVIDIGCGSGHQTQFLASKYDGVVGVDISSQAIRLAKEKHPDLNFLQKDLFDKGQVQDLCERIGPANLYVRGVLHQTPSDMRPSLLDSLRMLLGTEGRVFFHDTVIDSQAKFSSFPKALRRILVSRYGPKHFEQEELEEIFPSSSNTHLKGESFMPIFRRDEVGGLFRIPSRYFLVTPTKTPPQ